MKKMCVSYKELDEVLYFRFRVWNSSLEESSTCDILKVQPAEGVDLELSVTTFSAMSLFWPAFSLHGNQPLKWPVDGYRVYY